MRESDPTFPPQLDECQGGFRWGADSMVPTRQLDQTPSCSSPALKLRLASQAPGTLHLGEVRWGSRTRNCTLFARLGVVQVFVFSVARRRRATLRAKTWFDRKVGVQGFRLQCLGFGFWGLGFTVEV